VARIGFGPGGDGQRVAVRRFDQGARRGNFIA
jgi:hypothetical protein